MLKKLKWLTLAVLLVLSLIVCLQNLATIQLRLLFSTIELPQAVVIGGALALGILIGLLASALWKFRSWRAQSARAKQLKQAEATASSEENK